MMDFLVNLFDKIRGTRQYRVLIKYYNLTGIKAEFKTYKEAMDFWNEQVAKSDYSDMSMERMCDNGSKVVLMSIKW